MSVRGAVGVLTLVLLCPSPVAAQAPPGRLHIVIIAGEDAINVIQQGSATAPIVEVRDRNNQPVAGALVRFAVRSGRATFNGARTLSVTTDAAGRAVALGYSPTSVGPLQLTATATFQGQTAATVTIAQTNTALAAGASGTATATGTAAAGAAGGATAATSGGAAAGAAGGGVAAGGGLSATTIGIVGGAIAGGTLVTTEVVLPKITGNEGTVYQGSYSFTVTLAVAAKQGPGGSCTVGLVNQGTFRMRIKTEGDSVTGEAETEGTIANAPGTCPPLAGGPSPAGAEGPVTGTLSAVSWDVTQSGPPGDQGVARTTQWKFSGALQGDAIAGTLSLSIADDSATANASGSASVGITLTPQ